MIIHTFTTEKYIWTKSVSPEREWSFSLLDERKLRQMFWQKVFPNNVDLLYCDIISCKKSLRLKEWRVRSDNAEFFLSNIPICLIDNWIKVEEVQYFSSLLLIRRKWTKYPVNFGSIPIFTSGMRTSGLTR